MRLIDADALVEAMLEARREETDTVLKLIRFIEKQPTIEPKRGRWIKLDMRRGMEQYKCSVCGGATYVPEVMGQPVYNYCPNCGARADRWR